MMILALVGILAAGFLCGVFGLFSWLTPIEGDLVVYAVYLMVFICSIGIGAQYREGTGERLSWKIFLFAVSTIAGSFLGAAVASIFLPVSLRDAIITAAGMGWYSLATGMVYTYSPSLSVAVFIYCVAREVIAMLLSPLLIKKFRQPEVVSLSGSATINTSVAIASVTKDNTVVLYGLVVGTMITLAVPVMLGALLP